MIVVSDASVLIGLARLGLWRLLGEVYDRVVIPSGVRDEFLAPEHFRVERTALLNASWIDIRAARNDAMMAQLPRQLGRGEREAITLAVELRADLLLIDELDGRRAAKSLKLAITGIGGLLVVAKSRGLIPAVAPLLMKLQTECGFRLSNRLIAQLSAVAGEQIS